MWGGQTRKEEGQERVHFSNSCTGWYKKMKAGKVKLGLCYISFDLKHTPTWPYPRGICFHSSLAFAARSYFPSLPESEFNLCKNPAPTSYMHSTSLLSSFSLSLSVHLGHTTRSFKFTVILIYSSQFNPFMHSSDYSGKPFKTYFLEYAWVLMLLSHISHYSGC